MTRRFSSKAGLLLNLALVLAALVLFLAPRLLDGHAAMQWTRYHAERATAGRSVEHAREAGRAAVAALDLLAPLPWGAEAARVALDLGRRLSSRDSSAALAVVGEVRGGLEQIRASRFRGFGLGSLADEARELEEQAAESPGAAEARP